MDKELTELTPTNLDGSEIESPVVKTASVEEAQAVAEAEKEKKEDYYVDPFEQDALMAEKRKKIESEKNPQATALDLEKAAEKKQADEESAPITPDLNVAGFFSNGATAKKASSFGSPASASTITLAFLLAIVNVAYAGFFAVMLLGSKFSTHWFLGLIYAYVLGSSIFVAYTGLRSRNVPNEDLKKKSLFGLLFSGIAIIPLIMVAVNWLINLA